MIAKEKKNNPLSGKTPEEAGIYVETNVTDLATAKELLKKIAVAIIILQNQIDELKVT